MEVMLQEQDFSGCIDFSIQHNVIGKPKDVLVSYIRKMIDTYYKK